MAATNYSDKTEYDCKGPSGIYKLAPWVEGFKLNDDGDDFVDLDDEVASYPDVPQLWPYQTSTGDMKYPFTMRKAMLEVLEAKDSKYAEDPSVLPSLTCPDCNAYDGDYLSIPFFVNATKPAFPLFPPLSRTRDRIFNDKFRVLGGVQVTQERHEVGQCENFPKSVEGNFESTCTFDLPGNYLPQDAKMRDETTDPFGTDPTFVSTESLYRASNNWAKFYSSAEMRGEDTPYGFFYDGGCLNATNPCHKHTVSGFPIFFHVNLNVSHAQKFFNLIYQGGYIDQNTTKLKLSIPLLSYEFGKYTLCSVAFTPSPSGAALPVVLIV